MARPKSMPSPLTKCDDRSLAVARLLLGILLLVDLGQRWSQLAAHYSDFGVLPRALLLRTCWNSAWFSFATLSGHLLGLHLFFLVFLGSIVSFALGYQARWSTWAVWIGLVSIQNRNPLVLDSADSYLRLVLFWMLFLPLGTRWSCYFKAQKTSSFSVSSLAYLGLTGQVCLVMGLAVTSGVGLVSAGPTAVLAKTLIGLAAILLWFPYDRGQTRGVGVLLLILVSAALGWQSQQQGFFFAVSMCAVPALLPSWWWDGPLARRLPRWGRLPEPPATESVTAALSARWVMRSSRPVFALFVLWVFATDLVMLNRTAKDIDPDWPPAIMFLRLDTPTPNQVDLSPLTVESGRFLMEGVYRDGTLLKRADVVETSFDLSNRRWRNYLTSLRASRSEPLLQAYGEFLSRKRWTSPNSLQALTRMKVSFLRSAPVAGSGQSSRQQEELFLQYPLGGAKK